MSYFLRYYVRCIETGLIHSDAFDTLSDAIIYINQVKTHEDHFEILREDQI